MKNQNNKSYIKSNNSGFTLVELMVSISIFTIIMVMAMGSVIVASNAASKAREFRTAMDNVNFAMESMTRSIRMGTGYVCKDGYVSGNVSSLNNCTSDIGNAIEFTASALDEQPGEIVTYALYDRGNDRKGLQRCTSSSGCIGLISDEVSISKLGFLIRGNESGDGIQPSVYITIEGTVNIKNEPTVFAIQTLTSQRNLDLEE